MAAVNYVQCHRNPETLGRPLGDRAFLDAVAIGSAAPSRRANVEESLAARRRRV
jgi:hypothetical protein